MSYYSDESLVAYIDKLEAYPPLTEEQELEADPDTLVLHTLRYVIKIAKRYVYRTEDLFDYIQEGNLGLLQAIQSYDASKGAFISWATGYIQNRMRVAQIFNKSVIKLPQDAYTYYHRIQQLAKDTPRETIAKELKVKPYIVDIVLDHKPMEGVYEDTAIGELDERENDLASVKKAIRKNLTERQKEVLESRLNGVTHAMIGDKLGVSHQRVERIEKQAIAILTGEMV